MCAGPVPNHLPPCLSCRPSDLAHPRSTVVGSFPVPMCRGLTSGRWAIFLPYSHHVSPSRLCQGPLCQNCFCAKAVQYETANRFPSMTLAPRLPMTSPSLCRFSATLSPPHLFMPASCTVSFPRHCPVSCHVTHLYPGPADDIMLTSS